MLPESFDLPPPYFIYDQSAAHIIYIAHIFTTLCQRSFIVIMIVEFCSSDIPLPKHYPSGHLAQLVSELSVVPSKGYHVHGTTLSGSKP